jgi:hypothetical protein
VNLDRTCVIGGPRNVSRLPWSPRSSMNNRDVKALFIDPNFNDDPGALALKPRYIARGIVRLAIMISLLAIAPLAWSGCLNLGGDSCHGTPDSCHDQKCTNVLKYGCTEGPGCFGPPCPDCSDTCAQNDQVSCSQQAGCTWDSRPKACTGRKVNASCLGMEKDQCQELSGCTWGPS